MGTRHIVLTVYPDGYAEFAREDEVDDHGEKLARAAALIMARLLAQKYGVECRLKWGKGQHGAFAVFVPPDAANVEPWGDDLLTRDFGEIFEDANIEAWDEVYGGMPCGAIMA